MDDDKLIFNLPDTKPGDTDYGCDFCGDAQPIWDYPAEDFAMPGSSAMRDVMGLTGTGPELTMVSRGCWGACEACSVLIEADDRPALLERQVTQYRPQLEHLTRMGMPPHLRARVLDGFRANSRANFTAFTQHRTGPRVLTGHEGRSTR